MPLKYNGNNGTYIPVPIYIYALQDTNVPDKKRNLFKKIFPPFKEIMKELILDTVKH